MVPNALYIKLGKDPQKRIKHSVVTNTTVQQVVVTAKVGDPKMGCDPAIEQDSKPRVCVFSKSTRSVGLGAQNVVKNKNS